MQIVEKKNWRREKRKKDCWICVWIIHDVRERRSYCREVKLIFIFNGNLLVNKSIYVCIFFLLGLLGCESRRTLILFANSPKQVVCFLIRSLCFWKSYNLCAAICFEHKRRVLLEFAWFDSACSFNFTRCTSSALYLVGLVTISNGAQDGVLGC